VYPDTAEVFDAKSRTWHDVAKLSGGRYGHTATVLPGGEVVLIDGDTADVYHPAADDGLGSWARGASLDSCGSAPEGFPLFPPCQGRTRHTATLLVDGTVLVAGGEASSGNPTPTAERFALDPRPAIAEVWPPSGPSQGGTEVTITGVSLYPANGVTFGRAAGTIRSSSDHRIVAVSPPQPQGTAVDITVTRADHSQGRRAGAFVYGAGSWSSASPLAQARYQHTATLLSGPNCGPNCGKVLVSGGTKGYYLAPSGKKPDQAALLSSELYDPAAGAAGKWTATKYSFSDGKGRFSHTATLLDGPACRAVANPPPYCGKVLVAGGEDATGNAVGTAELFDPATEQWVETPPGLRPRMSHTATLLKDGRVLVTGGALSETQRGRGSLATADIYDPVLGTWTPTGNLDACVATSPDACAGRNLHTAVLLPNGEVLVAGGLGVAHPGSAVKVCSDGAFNAPVCVGADGALLGSAEIYSPTTGTWRSAGSMVTPRLSHAATLIEGPACGTACGKVLVSGGVFDGTGDFTPSAELFDPGTGLWSATGPMRVARGGHTATPLAGGQVLVTGGSAAYVSYTPRPLDSAETFDPATGRWAYTSIMAHRRGIHTATALDGPACASASAPAYCGTVLVAGGAEMRNPDSTPDYTAQGSTEAYRPLPRVTNLAPGGGPASGDTPITITGALFTADSRVTFDGVPAASVKVVSSTEITAVSPAHGQGLAEVVVSGSGGSSISIPPNGAALFTYDSCGGTASAGQIAYQPGVYSLIGVPAGLHVPSDSLRYGWTDRNSGSYDHFDPTAQTTESGHGYWAWFACARPFALGTGSDHAAFALGAYHASMVGNPSSSSPATLTGHDFAATWDPGLNGGAGGYHISGYQEAQSLPVGYGSWVFSYHDTTVSLQAPAP